MIIELKEQWIISGLIDMINNTINSIEYNFDKLTPQ